MDVNGNAGDIGGDSSQEMHEVGPLTYRQGYVSVWFKSFGTRAEALMNDHAVVGVYTGTPEKRGDQLFRAWVDAEELPAILGHWANVLR